LRSISEDRNYGTAKIPLQLHSPQNTLFPVCFLSKSSLELRAKPRHAVL